MSNMWPHRINRILFLVAFLSLTVFAQKSTRVSTDTLDAYKKTSITVKAPLVLMTPDSATAKASLRLPLASKYPGASITGGGYLWPIGEYLLYQTLSGKWDTLSVVGGAGTATKQGIIDSLNAAVPDSIELTHPLTVSVWAGFTGPNSGTATAGSGDSIQVSVDGMGSGALIVVSYNADTVITTTHPAVAGRKGSGGFTIYADSGRSVTYWILSGGGGGGGGGGGYGLLNAGPLVMGDSAGVVYTPLATDSLVIMKVHITGSCSDSGAVGFEYWGGSWIMDGYLANIDTNIVIVDSAHATTLWVKPFNGLPSDSLAITPEIRVPPDTTVSSTPAPGILEWNGYPEDWTMQHTVKVLWDTVATITDNVPDPWGIFDYTKEPDDSVIAFRYDWYMPSASAGFDAGFIMTADYDGTTDVMFWTWESPVTPETYVVLGVGWGAALDNFGNKTYTGLTVKWASNSGGPWPTETITDPAVEVLRPLEKKKFAYTHAADDSLIIATFHIEGSSPYIAPGTPWPPYFKALGWGLALGDSSATIVLHWDPSAAYGVDSTVHISIRVDTMTVGRTDTVRLKFIAYDSLDVMHVTRPYVTIIKKIAYLDFERMPERPKDALWVRSDEWA